MHALRDGRNDILPANPAMTNDVVFFVFPGFQILDLTGPLAVFEVANRFSQSECYGMRAVSREGGLVRSSSGLSVQSELASDDAPHTLTVVGGEGARAAAACSATLALVRSLAARSVRVSSVCSGAFVLAAADLLGGRTVTTHWSLAAELKRRFPTLKVAADRIFVTDGNVWTSAGITAGIDLALAMVAADRGESVARAAARELVVYYRRPGGQSQFSELSELEGGTDRITRVLGEMKAKLGQPLPVERMAEMAGMSPRQFSRVFQAETGCTPAKAVERLRVEAARLRVEQGGEKLDRIARETGFIDADGMRRAFVRTTGHPPQALRRAPRGNH